MIHKLLDAYSSIMDELYKDGGRKFLFGNIPPLDKSPFIRRQGNGIAEACGKYIAAYNVALACRVTEWGKEYTDVSFPLLCLTISSELGAKSGNHRPQ